MIDLKKFPKLGVRVPGSLKHRVRQAMLDADKAGVRFDGDEMTMEAIFAAATLHLLSMGPAEMIEVLGRRVPQLEELFEAESVGGKVVERPVPEVIPGEVDPRARRRGNGRAG